MERLDHLEIRPERRPGELATGSIACPSCDAPVMPPRRMLVTEPLQCPFCAHRGLVRDFLSLVQPARPARVVVRVGARLRIPA